MNIVRIAGLFYFVVCLLSPSGGFARQSGSQPTNSQPSSVTGNKKAARSTPTPKDIEDAKTKGLVWVNTSTHVYHRGGSLYGTTKHGKFMTEDDAKKAGFREAQENGTSQKGSSSSGTGK